MRILFCIFLAFGLTLTFGCEKKSDSSQPTQRKEEPKPNPGPGVNPDGTPEPKLGPNGVPYPREVKQK